MINFAEYRNARSAMFDTSPPDFYYFSCEEHEAEPPLPYEARSQYVQLFHDGKPSCLLVHKNKASAVTKEEHDVVGRLGFRLPEPPVL